MTEIAKNPHWCKIKEIMKEVECKEELTDNIIKEIEINLKLAKEYEELLKENSKVNSAEDELENGGG